MGKQTEEGTEQAQTFREPLEKLLRNRIRVEYDPEGPIELGTSKFGGKPHLPEGFDWPWYQGEVMEYHDRKFMTVPIYRPLAFLCQIDLGEAAPLDKEGLLPKSGLLSFFYEAESQLGGYTPEHKGCARVYYFPAGTALRETDFPGELPDYCRFPEQAITLEAAPSLPDWWDLEPDLREQFEDDYDLYDAAAEELDCEHEYASHLLGYPDLIQNPMGEDCEMIARGYDCGNGPVDLPPEKKAEIEAAAKDWTLLFQMGSVEYGDDFELMFGDAGCIYFWIRKQDLAEKNFDRVWLILQCS